ncbi:excalibur calcium-binding domain-containing protein [Arenimonas daejeonensis]|uniref:excalibur calcium-binding domain-containing protein n=1 Tax=Arenimonas daejeonensis TaxID=370777 RepID=UPI0011BFB478|nr:excalibur calcium-binding domain-containing protein [Arenimonas daejeonensis]
MIPVRPATVLIALALLAFAPTVLAHGGGTNADGCHTNRKTGDYHCHGAKRSAPPPANANNLSGAQPARGSAVYYANCTEARAAGAAPVRRGDPGYASHLDRDNDGVGCE